MNREESRVGVEIGHAHLHRKIRRRRTRMAAGVRVAAATGRMTLAPEGAPRAAFQQVERDYSTGGRISQAAGAEGW